MFVSYRDFEQSFKQYSTVVLAQEIAWQGQNVFSLFCSVQEKLKKDQPQFFLDGFAHLKNSRFCYFPLSAPSEQVVCKNLKSAQKDWSRLQHILEQRQSALDKRVPPFCGGAFGFLSYDCARFFESSWQQKMPPDNLKMPLFAFYFYDEICCIDLKSKKIYILLAVHRTEKKLKQVYDVAQTRLKKLAVQISKVNQFNFSPFSCGEFSAHQTPSEFKKNVRQVQNYIRAGDVYQVNMSQRFSAHYRGSELDYYARLRQINPSPYSAFWQNKNFMLAGCSPELLLRKRGAILETRPIAGTRPRGQNKAADKNLEGELLLNAKERAEHVMLLDMERNDLGRVCKHGSVEVTQKMVIEKYSHVMHIVSHVKGKISADKNILDALVAVFPGGTITGCPKVRCMQILDELERERRGPFYGAIGWISYSGDAEFNLLIRNALLKRSGKNGGTIYLQTGAGIVQDSDEKNEFEECLSKRKALIYAAKNALQ